jgi:hypothetical protein
MNGLGIRNLDPSDKANYVRLTDSVEIIGIYDYGDSLTIETADENYDLPKPELALDSDAIMVSRSWMTAIGFRS